jgi:hypothetical protein
MNQETTIEGNKRIELTTASRYLQMQVRYWMQKNHPEYKVTLDDEQFYNANNGKRFIGLNFMDFPEKVAFLNIREDGDTRTAFNGFVQKLDQFKNTFENIW